MERYASTPGSIPSHASPAAPLRRCAPSPPNERRRPNPRLGIRREDPSERGPSFK